MATEKEEDGYRQDDPSDTDDDLMSPTAFLYVPNSLKDIHTPECARTPLSNDLSPLKPLEEKKHKRQNNKKYAFRKLITEKAVQDEADKKLLKMDNELKEGIEKGLKTCTCVLLLYRDC